MLLGAAAWFATLIVVAAAALNYDEYLGYRLNVLGRSYQPWPKWEAWWGWYLMHAGAVLMGLVAVIATWRARR